MKKFKLGFSLTETMILITILAIAIAALTPIISRKIINNAEAGTTLTGGAHGRYEIYYKEIICFNHDNKLCYEKTTDPDKKPDGGIFGIGGNSSPIIVFRRLDDSEYIKIKGGKAPTMDSNDTRDTLYEQIDKDVKVFRDAKGEIDSVEFPDSRKGGTKTKSPVGGNIIVESADVVYIKGEKKGDNEFEPDEPDDPLDNPHNLPCNVNNVEQRVIEGLLVNRAEPEKYPDTNNKLWEIKAGTPGKPADPVGEVTPIPWERLISGDNPIIDRPIPIDPVTKEPQPSGFDPGPNAINVKVHAVGGGGAGGGYQGAGSAVSPKGKSPDDPQIIAMKEELAKRFKEITGATIETKDLVKVVSDPNFHLKKYNEGGVGDGKAYIFLNTANGTITVKVDVRDAKYQVFPHQLLDYTKVLGSQIQHSVIYDMPNWGDFRTIYNGGFYAGIVGCGTAGGPSDGYTTIIDDTFKTWSAGCARKEFCPPESATCSGESQCFVCDSEDRSGVCLSSHIATAKPTKCVCNYDSCRPEYYSNIPKNYTDTASCPSTASCTSSSVATWNGTTCKNTYTRGDGGAEPPCATACVRPIKKVTLEKNKSGGKGGSGTMYNNVQIFNEKKLQSGRNGESWHMHAACDRFGDIPKQDRWAHSIGGSGGIPVSQASYDYSYNIAGESYSASEVGERATDAYNYVVGRVNADKPITSIQQDILNSFQVSSNINNTLNWVCQDICGGDSGTPGADGYDIQACDNTLGINTAGGGLYNHIYTWTIPYSFNQLTYGEAGKPGEYKTTTIAKVDGRLTFILGKGGVWGKKEDWNKNSKGPDGTDTVVRMNNKEVLRAHGGKGGSQSLKTNRYDLCFPEKDAVNTSCKINGDANKSTSCCYSERGMRSTRDIFTTASRMSAFENIKAVTGNSQIIGIGLGRGGEGAGSRANHEMVYGEKHFVNSSGYDVNYPKSSILPATVQPKSTTAPAGVDYANIPLAPSEMNFKGGDGAVIIVW